MIPEARCRAGPPIAPARITSSDEDSPWQDDVPELQQALR